VRDFNKRRYRKATGEVEVIFLKKCVIVLGCKKTLDHMRLDSPDYVKIQQLAISKRFLPWKFFDSKKAMPFF